MSAGMYYWGIDPSTTKAGFAVLDSEGKVVKSGAIHPPNQPTMGRIISIRESMDLLMYEYPPIRVAIEEPFLTASTMRSGLAVAAAFTTMMLLCVKHMVPYVTVKPTTVKARAGNGGFSKTQMQESARLYFELGKIPGPDEADALWVATIALSSERTGEKGVTNWLE